MPCVASGRPRRPDWPNASPETLIGLPVLRAGQVSARYDVTHQAAMNALRRLEQFGLLTSRTDHGRITFRAGDVINLLAQ
jgi:hypothetical protein